MIDPPQMGSPLDDAEAFSEAPAHDASLYAAATGQEEWDASAVAVSEDLTNIRPVPRVAIQAFCQTRRRLLRLLNRLRRTAEWARRI